MQKITSFTIDHLKLQPGVYVSRKDPVGNSLITTFDIRMTSPNEEPVMNTAEVHTIEHLGATFLRNHPDFGSKTIYFGPMGCRTGFYLLLAGDYTSADIVPLMTEMFTFIRDYHDEVPGAFGRGIDQVGGFDLQETFVAQEAADLLGHLVTQDHVALQGRTAQVEVAVFQADLFVDVDVVFNVERRRLRRIEDAQFFAADFDRTGLHLGVDRIGVTHADDAADDENVFRADLFCLIERGLFVIRRGNDLYDARAVAEVDENQSAVVAAAFNPAG